MVWYLHRSHLVAGHQEHVGRHGNFAVFPIWYIISLYSIHIGPIVWCVMKNISVQPWNFVAIVDASWDIQATAWSGIFILKRYLSTGVNCPGPSTAKVCYHRSLKHGHPLVAEVWQSPVQSHGTVCLLSWEHSNSMLRRLSSVCRISISTVIDCSLQRVCCHRVYIILLFHINFRLLAAIFDFSHSLMLGSIHTNSIVLYHHWNFVAIVCISWDIPISSLEAAILIFCSCTTFNV